MFTKLYHTYYNLIIAGNGLTSMTINLYKNLMISMTSTPSKMHYLFNLKDISKVTIAPNYFNILFNIFLLLRYFKVCFLVMSSIKTLKFLCYDFGVMKYSVFSMTVWLIQGKIFIL